MMESCEEVQRGIMLGMKASWWACTGQALGEFLQKRFEIGKKASNKKGQGSSKK
jgi:hypothetical protein